VSARENLQGFYVIKTNDKKNLSARENLQGFYVIKTNDKQ